MIAFDKRRGEDCLSDLALDRHLLDELTADEAQHAATHLGVCTACADRLQILRADRDHFLATAPALAARPALRLIAGGGAEAPPAPERSWLTWLSGSRTWIALAAIAAAVLAVAVIPPAEEGTRTKGHGVRFGVYIKHGDRVREGGLGDRVHPGDVLRFSYATDAARHVAVLSLDGARRANIYFPAGTVAEELPASRAGALPDGIELDGALGKELIFGLFCESAIELEPLRASLEQRGTLAGVPAGCVVERLELEKTAE